MVSINGTDMTWYGSCHLVCIDARVWKGKKMRNLRGIKERNWSPTKIAHYIYHTDIKSNFTQLRPKATVNTIHGPYCQASVALDYLERTLIGLLSLVT